jgi:hypothetical protein
MRKGRMDRLLKSAVEFYTARYALRTLIVLVWMLAGWRIVIRCFRRDPAPPEKITIVES